MKIYKVRTFVNRRIHRGRNAGSTERVDAREEIVINNLEYAKCVYRDYENEAEGYFQYRDYFGKVELFIPHRHENGTLAYYPDNEQYIERFVKEG